MALRQRLGAEAQRRVARDDRRAASARAAAARPRCGRSGRGSARSARSGRAPASVVDVAVLDRARVDDHPLVAAGRPQHPGVGAVERHRSGVRREQPRRRARSPARARSPHRLPRVVRVVRQQEPQLGRSSSSIIFGMTGVDVSRRRRRRARRRPVGAPRCSVSVAIVGGSSTSRRARCRRARPPGASTRPGRPRRRRPGCAGPSGIAATKNRVSKRFGSTSGVIQCAHGRSRSARSTSPRRLQQLGEGQRAVEQRQPVGLPVLAAGVRRRRCRASGPASRTPDSSNVSRTAAHTSDRASGSSQVSARRPGGRRRPDPGVVGDAPRRAGRPSRRGRRMHPGGEGHRRRPPQQVDLRAAATVAEQDDRRGVPRARPAAARRSASARHGVDQAGEHRPPSGRRPSAAGHRDDQLDLDRRVQRQDRDADRAAGVLAGIAEHLAEQLARAVDDRRAGR